jgi:hypothetical protein
MTDSLENCDSPIGSYGVIEAILRTDPDPSFCRLRERGSKFKCCKVGYLPVRLGFTAAFTYLKKKFFDERISNILLQWQKM